MSNAPQEFTPPSREEIASYAFHLWEAEGRQPNREMDYWLQAEAHLIADRQYEAGLLPRFEAVVEIAPARRKRFPRPALAPSARFMPRYGDCQKAFAK